MAGKAEHGPTSATGRPEIVDRAVLQAFVAEPECLEAGANDVEAAVVLGADGRASKQVFGQGERG